MTIYNTALYRKAGSHRLYQTSKLLGKSNFTRALQKKRMTRREGILGIVAHYKRDLKT